MTISKSQPEAFVQKIAFSGLILSAHPEIQEKIRNTGWLVDFGETVAGEQDVAVINTPLLRPLPELMDQNPEGMVLACSAETEHKHLPGFIKTGVALYFSSPFCLPVESVRNVLATARAYDVFVDMDFPLRFSCYQLVHNEIFSGALGDIRLVQITAPAPEVPPIRYALDKQLAFCPCALVPAHHLLDLVIWSLGNLKTRPSASEREYFFETGTGAPVQLKLQDDTALQITFQGTQGEISFRGNSLSPFHFEIFKHHQGVRTSLFEGEDQWAGRSFLEWRRKVSLGLRYDSQIESLMDELVLLAALEEATAPHEE